MALLSFVCCILAKAALMGGFARFWHAIARLGGRPMPLAWKY
jgi:hypothetical protein